jgi:ethanolamine permease
MGGHFLSWMEIYQSGFAGSLFSILFTGIGYICLCFCVAELSSALPFSGGIYGFVRAFLGPYYGFLVAFYDILFNVLYVSRGIIYLSYLPSLFGYTSVELKPIFALLMYVICNGMCILGENRTFWKVNRGLGIISLLLMVLYLVGTLKQVNFDKWANNTDVYHGNLAMSHLLPSTWLFVGIEYLPLASSTCSNPRQDVPMAFLMTVGCMLVLSVAMIVIVAGQAPGLDTLAVYSKSAGLGSGMDNLNNFEVIRQILPLTAGYSSLMSISTHAAAWLSVLPVFASIVGFVWAYGKQLAAIAESGLLPSFFAWRTDNGIIDPTITPPVSSRFTTFASSIVGKSVPYMALFSGSFISFAVTLLILLLPSSATTSDHSISNTAMSHLGDIAAFAAYITYIYLFCSYITFKGRYSTVARTFESPLGVYGALLGLAIQFVQIISIIGFRDRPRQVALIVIGILGVVGSIFYFQYLAKKQKFSDSEKKEFFKAYLIKGKIILQTN